MPGHIRIKARGRTVRRVPGQPNKLEQQYGDHLKWRKHTGEILQYEFDAVRLRLAESTFYTPDYFVMLADGTIELHEVKGFWEDDARVKIKLAARLYPFVFVAAQRKRGQWEFERFGE